MTEKCLAHEQSSVTLPELDVVLFHVDFNVSPNINANVSEFLPYSSIKIPFFSTDTDNALPTGGNPLK